MVGTRAPARPAPAGVRGGGGRCGVSAVHAPRAGGRRQVPSGGGVRLGRRRPRRDPARPVPALRRRASRTSRSSRRSSRRRAWPTSTCPRSSRPRSVPCWKATSTRTLVCRHVSQLMGVAEAARGRGDVLGDPALLRGLGPRATAGARVRRHPLGRADVPRPRRAHRGLVARLADPAALHGAARPARRAAGWGGGKLNAATVSLEPLSEEQSAALIANLLGSTELPTDVAERIVETAEGNPLFVEETLAMLIDDGLVVREDDRWVAAGDLSDVTVPPSIQALLAARLDRLSARGARRARGGGRRRQGVLRRRGAGPRRRGRAVAGTRRSAWRSSARS